jgi:tetratricopeptide (TPR) repeat protein
MGNPDQSSSSWFYEVQGGHAGPVTIESICDLVRRGIVSDDTLVWNETFGEVWKPIRDTEIPGRAQNKDPSPLPPPLPPRTVPNQQPRDGPNYLEFVWALPAIVATVIFLTAIGSVSLWACSYISILVGIASAFFLVKPFPKFLLTRTASVCVLAVAALSAVFSSIALLSHEQKARKACVPERNIAGCTLIIQDQSASPAVRSAAYLSRGLGYHDHKDYERAIGDYAEVIKFDPNDAIPYYNRGLAYHAKGEADRAIADYSAAIKLDAQYESDLQAAFRKLDSAAYDKLIAEQRQKREKLRKEEETKLLDQVKQTSPEDLDKLRSIYDRVVSLDDNEEFRQKAASLARQIQERDRKKEISNLKGQLKTVGLDVDTQYKIYSRLSEIEPNNSSFKAEAEKLQRQIEGREVARRAAEEKTKRDAELAALCPSDWTKCADNEQLVNKYSRWIHAQVACKMEANSQAKYGDPVWPWLAFSSFYGGKDYVTSGVAVIIEPDAKFQNGFGAMVHSRVVCRYDLRTERVVDVSIAPR